MNPGYLHTVSQNYKNLLRVKVVLTVLNSLSELCLVMDIQECIFVITCKINGMKM